MTNQHDSLLAAERALGRPPSGGQPYTADMSDEAVLARRIAASEADEEVELPRTRIRKMRMAKARCRRNPLVFAKASRAKLAPVTATCFGPERYDDEATLEWRAVVNGIRAAKEAALLEKAEEERDRKDTAFRARWIAHLATKGLTEETYANIVEERAQRWADGFDERCRQAREAAEVSARKEADRVAALCPECGGETLSVRGKTAPWLKYRVCSRISQPGHLDKEAVTARIEQMCAETETAGYEADWPDGRDSPPGLRELPSVLMTGSG